MVSERVLMGGVKRRPDGHLRTWLLGFVQMEGGWCCLGKRPYSELRLGLSHLIQAHQSLVGECKVEL